ncbi:hypothetical protein ACVGW8_00145 [Enterobacter hormaechei]
MKHHSIHREQWGFLNKFDKEIRLLIPQKTPIKLLPINIIAGNLKTPGVALLFYFQIA